MKLNKSQNDSMNADYAKRDSEYNASLDKLRNDHNQKLKQFEEDKINEVKRLRDEINGKAEAHQADQKSW